MSNLNAALYAHTCPSDVDYRRAEETVIHFLHRYWIPASVSARLLGTSTSAAYEWIEDHSRPPRRAWTCSPLYRAGLQRRGRINRARELYDDSDRSMRNVAVKLQVDVSTVYKYLQISRRGWYRTVAEKHADFTADYRHYSAAIKSLYDC